MKTGECFINVGIQSCSEQTREYPLEKFLQLNCEFQIQYSHQATIT
jgi:hypothetical protein